MAVDRQDKDPDSILAHYRRMLAFRRDNPVLVRGDIDLLPAGDQVLALLRSDARTTMLCLFNFSLDAADWAAPARLGRLRPVGQEDAAALSRPGGTVTLQPLSSVFALVG